MKQLALFLAIVTITLGSTLHCQSKPKVVQLGCASPMFAHVYDNPFKAIASAIGKDKKSAKFRVTWTGSLGSGWEQGTMLYDRKKSSLKYYDVGGAEEHYYRKSYLFSGIKDSTIINLFKIYNNEQQIDKLLAFTFIDLLPKHGYKKHKIADVEKKF